MCPGQKYPKNFQVHIEIGMGVIGQLDIEGRDAMFVCPICKSAGVDTADIDRWVGIGGYCRDSLGEDGQPIPEAHARHILVRVPTNDADRERAKALAQRVRGELVNGMDFGTMVRRYSKYPGPSGPDGDIGFISLGTLMPAIRAGLDTLEVGQVSEPLENQAGFNIFRVNERKAELLYEAIRGNGGTARLVMLPYESHGYSAMESNEHVLAESLRWFEKYVKAA